MLSLGFSETFSAPFSHVPVRRERLTIMNADPNPAKAIFLEAVEQHAPEHWPAFLDRACAGQPGLRRQVEALLEAHREVGTVQHQEHADECEQHPERGAVLAAQPGGRKTGGDQSL